MRVIKKYRFNLKTKVPYSDLPDIVHRFFEENNLSYGRFMYYFETHAERNHSEEELFRSSCAKILHDCPSLGNIRCLKGRYSDELYITNIDADENFDEGVILPLMKKIHRRYGFSESHLYYYDIDFFGKNTHFERDLSYANKKCVLENLPFDPTTNIAYQPYGSGIILSRNSLDGCYIDLNVDILHDGTVHDPQNYADAFQALIPIKIKPEVSVKMYLTDEERWEIERINETAAPITEKCREFLKTHLGHTSGENKSPSKFSLAKPMKKIGKKYGYEYNLVWRGGIYALKKRIQKGNVIYLTFDSGPSHYSVGCEISFQGVGFRISLGTSAHNPVNQEQTDEFIEHILSVLSGFEKTLLPELDSLYPETPEWFIPTNF